MAAFVLNIKRVNSGTTLSTGVVPITADAATLINSALTRNPDVVSVSMDVVSEAQLRGILQYASLISRGQTTTTVETAISALV